MGKPVKRNSQPFSTSQQVIERASNGGGGISCDSSYSDSTKEGSISSNSFSSSFSSSDLIEDASSSSSDGPLYQLSDLMEQLPIKRGLSKYYQGKSQSFTSIASVESLEDLTKRENPNYRNKIKYCKSYIGQRLCRPTSIISKKASSSSRGFFAKLERNRSYGLMARSPSVPVQKHF